MLRKNLVNMFHKFVIELTHDSKLMRDSTTYFIFSFVIIKSLLFVFLVRHFLCNVRFSLYNGPVFIKEKKGTVRSGFTKFARFMLQ